MKQYWKYIKPYWPYFVIGPLMMIVEVVGEVVMPYLLSVIINQGVGMEGAGRGIAFIIAMGILMVITALCMMGGGVGGAYFAIKASSNFANDLRKDVFAKIQSFSFANIDSFSTGSLITRLTNDITQLQNLITMALRMMLRSPGMFIGALIMAFSMNARLAAVIAVVIPVLVVVIVVLLKVSFPRFQKMQEKLDRLNSGIQENLTNVRVVKSFVRESYEQDKFAKANEDLKQTSINALKVMIFTMPLITFTMNATTMAVVWFGGNQIILGDMPVGDLTAFTNYVLQILMSLMMVSMVILNSSRAMASSKRIKEVLNTEVDLSDAHAEKKDLLVQKGDISFKNVKFRYYKNSEEWVLEDINVEIKGGQTVGIIGSTGCGKSTLVQMIPRLYDVDEGEIQVDGVNVKDYSLENLREGVGMVLQKNVLFSGTIMDNLRWGNADATDEEVYAAAKSAQAHDFICSFKDGYNTELGQGGVNVSGGQKQRLCIARALLKKPKILILDDSTSAVDTATEANIRACFANELKDTTKLIIAQRIGSVKDADLILVIDDGKIVGQGNHNQLLESCESYREIYESQADKEKEVSA